MIKKIKRKFVEYIYADHNHSKSVKANLHALLDQIEPGQVGLNVGAGYSRLHPQVKNLDIQDGPNIDYVGSADKLPFENNSFDLIITQETLEHVSDPFMAMNEISRILKPGGKLYCQLPFIIGFHPGPYDYWRFSAQGIEELVKRSGLKILSSGITVGGASGYYRVSVEFWCILFSFGRAPFYKAFKAIFALLLYPIKWLDFLFDHSPEKDRIPGGYFVIAQKD